jgi:hypothetical protein
VRPSRREYFLAGVALFLGLWGIGWGLPGRERLAAVLPPSADTPEVRAALAASWRDMHQQKGPNLMISPTGFATFEGVQRARPGWKTPPELLQSSARSFYLRSASEDEQTLLLAFGRMRPRQLQFHPHMFVYGGAYLYPLGAWLAVNSIWGLTYLTHSVEDYLAVPERMASLYRCGRLLSVLAYLACVLLVHRTGVMFFDKDAGLLAALIFALSPAVVFQAHIMKIHTYWPFFALLAFNFSCRVVKSGEPRWYRWAGVAAGLAVGTFMFAWPACLVIALACGIRVFMLKAKPARELRGLAEAAALSAVTFFLFNPYWLLDPGEVRQELAVLSRWSTLDLSHVVTFCMLPVRGALTLPVLAAAAAGVVLAFSDGKREPVRLLCGLSFLGALATTASLNIVDVLFQARYFVGWLGLAALLAAVAVKEFAPPRAWGRSLYGAAVLAALLNLGALSATYAYNCRLAA